MKLLTSLYGGASGNALSVAISRDGTELELPYKAIAELLWAYFLNNGLYDELRLAGYFADEPNLRAMRNPAARVVKFYADTVWPGTLKEGLPLDADSFANKKIEEPIKQLWGWSNWLQNKQLAVRLAAILGEVYIKVAQPKAGRIYLQLIRPEHVTDFSTDEQGNLTYIRVDVPQAAREEDKTVFKTHTEIWQPGRARFWLHKKDPDADIARLGTPVQDLDTAVEMGIDFVPFVRAIFKDVGGDRGVGSYLLSLEKIDEVNRMATRLHNQLFKHNDVTWALTANMVDAATGRPLPAPNIGTTTDDDGNEVVEMGGERMVRLPGNSSLETLIPALDYSAALDILESQVMELEKDLPELKYFGLQDAGTLSGTAIRLLMGPAITSAVEVRANMESALVRAQQMALTIGQAAKIEGWGDLGTFDDGDFEHGFKERDIIPVSRSERAEVIKAEKEAGYPLFTSMRSYGATEEEMVQLEEDKAREAELESAGLANALNEMDSGLASAATSVPANGAGGPPGGLF